MVKRLLLIIFFFACMASSLIAQAWLVLCVIFSPNGQRAMNIVLSHDQLFNAVTGGDMDETLSSRASRLRANKRWAHILCKMLNALDKGHCDKSIGA